MGMRYRRIGYIAVIIVALILIAWRAHTDVVNDKFGSAARFGDIATVRAMLNRGINPNVNTGQDATALNWATYNGHDAIAQLLLEHGADPTPALRQAVMMKRRKILRMLIIYGADMRSRDGTDAVDLAEENHWEDIVDLIKAKSK